MLQVNDQIAIDEADLTERFVLASGPGGQRVNKTSSAVELRFDLERSDLPPGVKARAAKLAGRRLTQDGVLVLFAQAHSSQEMNRQAARERLLELLRKAAEPPPPPRKKTRPTKASKERRLAAKSRRGEVKTMRGRPGAED